MTTVVKKDEVLTTKQRVAATLRQRRRGAIMQGDLYRLETTNGPSGRSSSWKMKRCVLHDDRIECYDAGDGKVEEIPIGMCELSLLSEKQCPGDMFAFALKLPGGTITALLAADTYELRRRWAVGLIYQIGISRPCVDFTPFPYGPPMGEILDRRTIICGELQKKGQRGINWKNRFFKLTPRDLQYFEKDTLKGKFPLEGAYLKTDDRSLEFSLCPVGGSGSLVVMRADSQLNKSTWVLAIDTQLHSFDAKIETPQDEYVVSSVEEPEEQWQMNAWPIFSDDDDTQFNVPDKDKDSRQHQQAERVAAGPEAAAEEEADPEWDDGQDEEEAGGADGVVGEGEEEDYGDEVEDEAEKDGAAGGGADGNGNGVVDANDLEMHPSNDSTGDAGDDEDEGGPTDTLSPSSGAETGTGAHANRLSFTERAQDTDATAAEAVAASAAAAAESSTTEEVELPSAKTPLAPAPAAAKVTAAATSTQSAKPNYVLPPKSTTPRQSLSAAASSSAPAPPLPEVISPSGKVSVAAAAAAIEQAKRSKGSTAVPMPKQLAGTGAGAGKSPINKASSYTYTPPYSKRNLDAGAVSGVDLIW
jgi:hypothetical protein